jgi:hypothetical protein
MSDPEAGVPFLHVWRDAVRHPRAPIRPTTRQVLIELSYWMDPNGEGWRPATGLSERTGRSRSTIFDAIKQAEKMGYLRHKPGRTGVANTYFASLPRWVKFQRPESGHHTSHDSAPKGARAVGAAPSSLPEDECFGCGGKRALLPPDYAYCEDCRGRRR